MKNKQKPRATARGFCLCQRICDQIGKGEKFGGGKALAADVGAVACRFYQGNALLLGKLGEACGKGVGKSLAALLKGGTDGAEEDRLVLGLIGLDRKSVV